MIRGGYILVAVFDAGLRHPVELNEFDFDGCLWLAKLWDDGCYVTVALGYDSSERVTYGIALLSQGVFISYLINTYFLFLRLQ